VTYKRDAASIPPDAPREQAMGALLESARAFHKAGRLPEAEARYREILQNTPDHPDALHFLGMLAFQVGRLDAAAYLIRQGLAGKPYDPERHYDLGTALQRLNRTDEATASFGTALSLRPDYADAWFNLATLYDGQGNLDDAAMGYRRALALTPNDAGARNNLANVLHRQGRLTEAAAEMNAALRLAPRDANLHYNLANVLKDQGSFDDARVRYRQALALAPGHRPALENLAAVARFQRRAEETVECCAALVALSLRDARAHNALGNAYIDLGRPGAALECYRNALELEAVNEYKANFVDCLRNVEFAEFDVRLADLMIGALSEPWARPADLMKACCEMICLAPVIRDEVERAVAQWPARPPVSGWFDDDARAALAGSKLLRAALRSAPVCVLALERMLTMLRSVLLAAAESGLGDIAADDPQLTLYCALAEQCFVNEYVFFADDDESARVEVLRKAVASQLAAGTRVPALWLAAVAAYLPLGAIAGSDRLLTQAWPESVKRLLVQQIAEPREEDADRQAIARLTSIDEGVSRRVRQQYEENPYPRWIKAAPVHQALPLEAYLWRTLPHLPPPATQATRTLDVLVAGCGTGQEPIELARQLEGARVLAVDLSLVSLGYARRKTREVGALAIEYAHADIMRLGDLDRHFDLIQSYGVLHHLADPVAGLRILTSLLRPGGRMLLGLYSEHARAGVVAARKFISREGYGSMAAEIRRARQDLLAAEQPLLGTRLALFRDFYSTSECRDLLFHVNEHRFTLPDIEKALDGLGLRFTGFVVPAAVRAAYAARFPDDLDQTNLRHWNDFEAEFPYTFVGMYGFWVDKPFGA